MEFKCINKNELNSVFWKPYFISHFTFIKNNETAKSNKLSNSSQKTPSSTQNSVYSGVYCQKRQNSSGGMNLNIVNHTKNGSGRNFKTNI